MKNVLVFRGYTSTEYSREILNIDGSKVAVTIVPIGKPVLVRKKFKQLLSEYSLDDYDYIYLVSMSSCMTSLLDKKYFKKICMITPFFLYFRSVSILFKSRLKDFFGCYILMLLNRRMGVFNQDIRVKLAEFDRTTDNIFFQKRFTKVDTIRGVDHYLGELGVLDIVKNDIGFLLSKSFPKSM